MPAGRWFSLLAAVSAFSPVLAQRPADIRHSYERALCVVPMTGAGTPSDPRRPLFAPWPPKRGAPGPEDIVSYSYQLSDDGKFALVDFAARDRAAFQKILDAKHPEVKVFERGRSSRGQVELEFRKYRKDFDLQRFLGGRP